MKMRSWRAPLSSLFLLLILAAFCLNSFAVWGANSDKETPLVKDLPDFHEFTSMLTTKGSVLLNGRQVRTGSTVVNGSVIQTDTGAHAMIEAGPLGRVDLDSITAVLLTYGDRSVQANLNKCGKGMTVTLPEGIHGLVKILNISDVGVLAEHRDLDVKVYRGEAVVKYGQGKEYFLKAGEHRDFDNATEVISNGDSSFKVYCDENHVVPLLGLPALALPFIFGGSAAAVAAVQPPFLSTLQP